MENLGSIIVTSLATLLVTIVGALIIDFVRKIKPKITCSVKESIPIDLDGKKIGANIIEIRNPSSKTVDNVVIKIGAEGIDIRNSGVKTTHGLEYEIIEHTGVLEIKIPFLKHNDHVSVTSILEDDTYVPQKPQVTVRSPDSFKFVELDGEAEGKSTSPVTEMFFPAITAATVVAMTLISVTRLDIPFVFNKQEQDFSVRPVSYGARDDQATNLVLAAVLSNLPDLSEKYVVGNTVYYYNQGPYVYSLAKDASSKEEISRYVSFLNKAIEISPRMSPRSKSAIYFFMAKIALLQNEEVKAAAWMSKSKDESEEEHLFLSSQFELTDD